MFAICLGAEVYMITSYILIKAVNKSLFAVFKTVNLIAFVPFIMKTVLNFIQLVENFEKIAEWDYKDFKSKM